MLLRLQWLPVSDLSGARLGSQVIVSDVDAPPPGAGGAGGKGGRPYMAEIIEWGAHWQGGGQSGYYALTRELPDGERLAAEWSERQRRSRLLGE